MNLAPGVAAQKEPGSAQALFWSRQHRNLPASFMELIKYLQAHSWSYSPCTRKHVHVWPPRFTLWRMNIQNSHECVSVDSEAASELVVLAFVFLPLAFLRHQITSVVSSFGPTLATDLAG